MMCLKGSFKLFPFFSSPQEIRLVFFQWEKHSVTAYPSVSGHLRFAQRANSHLALQVRHSLKLSTGNTTNLSKRQADTEHTLAEVQGPAEPATIASLRERHVLSNGHKLFFITLTLCYIPAQWPREI